MPGCSGRRSPLELDGASVDRLRGQARQLAPDDLCRHAHHAFVFLDLEDERHARLQRVARCFYLRATVGQVDDLDFRSVLDSGLTQPGQGGRGSSRMLAAIRRVGLEDRRGEGKRLSIHGGSRLMTVPL